VIRFKRKYTAVELCFFPGETRPLRERERERERELEKREKNIKKT
jgi:hypothetical protein